MWTLFFVAIMCLNVTHTRYVVHTQGLWYNAIIPSCLIYKSLFLLVQATHGNTITNQPPQFLMVEPCSFPQL
jgi:hypothetical protein